MCIWMSETGTESTQMHKQINSNLKTMFSMKFIQETTKQN